MSDNPYVTDLCTRIDAVLVALAPLPNGCARRWAPWTARRLRRQVRAVETTAAALFNGLEAAEEHVSERAHALRTAGMLLAALPTAAALPDRARYRAYVDAWLPGLTDAETAALRSFFGCGTGELADHVTTWGLDPERKSL